MICYNLVGPTHNWKGKFWYKYYIIPTKNFNILDAVEHTIFFGQEYAGKFNTVLSEKNRCDIICASILIS